MVIKASDDRLACYAEKKQKLQMQIVNKADATTQPIGLYKKTSNLFRPRDQATKSIDVRDFTKIIDIDPINLTATVEGMISYQDLVEETLKLSCLPTVVPELKSITIGGALAGCGIESSSFCYGLVHETIQEMDVLLGDGRIITCTPTNEHKDLFYAMPNSYGSLGYALKVKVQLIPVKKFVRLTHQKFSEAALYFEALKAQCTERRQQNLPGYIDGVIFSKNEMYITTADFVETAPYLSNYTYQNIYYQSIRKRSEDFLSTYDYIWRWDADWFWCSKVFGMQNALLRTLCGKWMLSSTVYTKIMHFFNRHSSLKAFLNSFYQKKESIIQDALIPAQNALDFFNFFKQEIGIFPIWICPIQSYDAKAYDFCPLDKNTLYLDFGFWDSVYTNREEGFFNRKIERMVAQLNGFKSLYSSSFYTREEFWKLYSLERYQQLKQRYDPDNHLKDLFTKCCQKSSG